MFTRIKTLTILSLAALLALAGCSEQATTPSGTVTGTASSDVCFEGKVYLDTNYDGDLDADDVEPGIPDVTVFVAAGDNIFRVKTDENGTYKFVLPGAVQIPYRLAVAPGNSWAMPDFNATLWFKFFPTTPHDCQLPAANTVKNFGFGIEVEGIIEAVEQGIIKTNGEPTNYWKSQINSQGFGYGRPMVEEALLLAYLQHIKETTLLTEFLWTPGNELAEALAILSANSSATPRNQLLASLLTTELNNCAAKGIVGFPGLQLVVINYAENVVIDNPVAAPNVLGLADDEVMLSTKLMLDTLNWPSRGGGGGGVQ